MNMHCENSNAPVCRQAGSDGRVKRNMGQQNTTTHACLSADMLTMLTFFANFQKRQHSSTKVNIRQHFTRKTGENHNKCQHMC
jgi:hypothetical protein